MLNRVTVLLAVAAALALVSCAGLGPAVERAADLYDMDSYLDALAGSETLPPVPPRSRCPPWPTRPQPHRLVPSAPPSPGPPMAPHRSLPPAPPRSGS